MSFNKMKSINIPTFFLQSNQFGILFNHSYLTLIGRVELRVLKIGRGAGVNECYKELIGFIFDFC